MNVNNRREKILVYVRGYRGTTFFSKAIRWITRGEYTHNSLVFINGRHCVELEAIEGKGVIKHYPNSPETHDFDEYTAPLDWEQSESAYLLPNELLGSGYDKLGIIGFLIHKKVHNPFKYFCSEYVAYILWKAGYPLSRREPYRDTPASVCESLRLLERVEPVGGA